MASQLPPEQLASYSAIIDSILSVSDLTTISAKRIRKGLQEQVDYDITPQKQPITELIMQRFDKFENEQTGDTNEIPPEPAPTANGTVKHEDAMERQSVKENSTKLSPPTSPSKRKVDDESEELSDVVDTPPPKKVKKTKPKPEAETDEQLAKRMQAEFNALSGRATRGGGPKKKAAVAKKPKKKSKAKIGSDEDSEVDGNASPKPEKEKKGGFHKQMVLSEPLSAMLNETTLSRPQTVKQIWAYVKERDLQDPSDKRQIRCDGAMQAVFKQPKVHMFTMNKLLANHLHPADE